MYSDYEADLSVWGLGGGLAWSSGCAPWEVVVVVVGGRAAGGVGVQPAARLTCGAGGCAG